jgi:hypothetical protein
MGLFWASHGSRRQPLSRSLVYSAMKKLEAVQVPAWAGKEALPIQFRYRVTQLL